MITDHIYNMTVALRAKNTERAAFEAAWMSHAIADGLTPAHHYPLEAKLEELRGEGIETRITTKDKLLMPGDNRRHQLRNNWEYWGAKGVMTTHLSYELGIATSIAPLRFDECEPTDEECERVVRDGFEVMFLEMLHQIADMDMYKEYTRSGWTRRLARETRNVLLPIIIKAVVLAWYQSVYEASRKA
jgi:hypothetical protein